MVAIFVAFMFISLVLTDLGVQKWTAWQAVRAAKQVPTMAVAGSEPLWQVPEGVNLSEVHTWLRPDPTGGLEIGVDTLITHAVGAIRRVVLPRAGEQIAAGQPLFRLEQGGRSLTVPSTITGKVMSVNSRLQKQPGLLTSDPYSSGWICRVIPTTRGEATPNLLFGQLAMTWLGKEFDRLREFLSVQMPPELALGATSQDGGEPVPGCLSELKDEAWSAFEAEFLKSR